MELQESDEEMEDFSEDMMDNDMVEVTASQFEVKQDKKKQKRQIQWGPVQRMPRPRRFPEDGKTVMQRAEELKEYKNLCKGTKPSMLTAFGSNKSYIDISSCVNVSLGSTEELINYNADLIRERDAVSRNDFIEKNAEINLPSDLNVDLNPKSFPSLVGETSPVETAPLKENVINGDKS